MSNNKEKKYQGTSIPEPSLRRLPWYLSYVKLLIAQNRKSVSSTVIAQGVGVDASLVAKDLSYLDLKGRTRVGYNAMEIVSVLEDFLGFTSSHHAVVVGVGCLGSALMQDAGLQQFGLHIEAGFDVNPDLVGTNIGGLPIYHLDQLSEYVEKSKINIAVLTVPIKEAQTVSDLIVASKIQAIWNFTPYRISVPKEIVVQNTSMYSHLALMFTRLRSIKHKKPKVKESTQSNQG